MKAGYVVRLMRGSYLNVFKGDIPDVEEVACFLRWPSYVSCEWALNYHGVILQAPNVCTAITLASSVGMRNRLEYQDITIEYSRIAKSLFWGFETTNGSNMATPEKALVDTAYLRNHVPFSDELETSKLNLAELKQIVGLYPTTVQKRVAFITRNS
jgi:predicted transcriptional regulator of viral defense system